MSQLDRRHLGVFPSLLQNPIATCLRSNPGNLNAHLFMPADTRAYQIFKAAPSCCMRILRERHLLLLQWRGCEVEIVCKCDDMRAVAPAPRSKE